MLKHALLSSSVGLLLLAISPVRVLADRKPSLAEVKNIRELSVPIEGAQIVSVKTRNGSITVTGEATDNCKVSATVHAKASTPLIADDLAEKTRINVKRSGSELIIDIKKPRTLRGQSVWVDLDVRVAHQLAVRCGSHNGPVTVANVARTRIETHNGRIALERVSGRVEAESHNGSIRCSNISGPTAIKSHNGSVSVRLGDVTHPESTIQTYNGKVNVDAPPGLSARVSISSHNGRIVSDLPITVKGRIRREELVGTIGDGAGNLVIKTHNGSIHIREFSNTRR